MAFDSHKNFAYSLIAIAPSPSTSGTSITVTSGQGALFPTPPFNATVWAAASIPITTNSEIVRVTNIAGDVLTITRAQESTTARAIIVGDQIANTITAKTLTDVENASYPPLPHDMITAHTYTGGANLDVFGLSAASVIAKLTPSSTGGATAHLLSTDASGNTTVVGMLSTTLLVGGNQYNPNVPNSLKMTAVTWAALAGTVGTGGGGTTVTGVGTSFLTDFKIGDEIGIDALSGVPPNYFGVILSITSDTVLTTDRYWIGTTGSNYRRRSPVWQATDASNNILWTIDNDGQMGFGGGVSGYAVGDLISFGKKILVAGAVGSGNLYLDGGYTVAGVHRVYTNAGSSLQIVQDTSNGTLTLATTLNANAYHIAHMYFKTSDTQRMQIFADGGVSIANGVDVTQLLVTGFTTQTNELAQLLDNTANTNAIRNILRIEEQSTGTSAAGLGAGLRFALQSSTTVNQDAARLTASWVVATHASRTARLALLASDSAGEREGMRIEASGTAPLVGFYGASAVARATTGGTAATFVANTSGIANDTATWGGYTVGQVVKALQNIGILT